MLITVPPPAHAAALLARAARNVGSLQEHSRLQTLEFDEALHPRDESGKWTDGSSSSSDVDDRPIADPKLAAQADAGAVAVEQLVPQALEHAAIDESEAPIESWDDVDHITQDEVYEKFTQDAISNGVDVDTSDLQHEIEQDLRRGNDDIIKATERDTLAAVADKFEDRGEMLPVGNAADDGQFKIYEKLDPESLVYNEDDGDGATLDLSELRMKGDGVHAGRELTEAEQDIVATNWDNAYERNFNKELEHAFESDSYYEQVNQLEADAIQSEWSNLTSSAKLDLIHEYGLTAEPRVSSTPRAGQLPERWVTGVDVSDVDTADYARTGAIARELVTLRTNQLLADRHLSLTGMDTRPIQDTVWEGWKTSSSGDAGLALQLATAREFDGLHRMSPNEVQRAEQWASKHYGGLDRMQAYSRAQWETTQFIMKKSGEDIVNVYRAVMLDARALNGTTNEVLSDVQRPAYGQSPYVRLPDLALQRAGAQSTTGKISVANNWNGVGNLPLNPERVVIRVSAPRTSVLSIPVYGQNEQGEHETVLAGMKDRWAWDVYRRQAPEFDMVPLRKSHRVIKAAARKKIKARKKPLTIDLQAADRGQPHWLSNEPDAVVVRARERQLRTRRVRRTLDFNPDQARDEYGRWTDTGASVMARPSSDYTPAHAEGRDTHERFTDAHGRYTAERTALHNAIIDKYMASTTSVKQPVATILGGGPASGKSTIVKSEHIGQENTVLIDVDKIRRELPEYKERIGTDPNVSAFTHEESSHIAKQLTRRASETSRHLVLDGTGDSSIEKLGGKVAAMRAAGHRIEAHYVTVDVETALSRMRERAMTPGVDFGRYVPETFVRATHAAISRTFPEAIKQGMFDRAELYDTSGDKTTHVVTTHGKQLTIHDQVAWDRFLAKGDAR